MASNIESAPDPYEVARRRNKKRTAQKEAGLKERVCLVCGRKYKSHYSKKKYCDHVHPNGRTCAEVAKSIWQREYRKRTRK